MARGMNNAELEVIDRANMLKVNGIYNLCKVCNTRIPEWHNADCVTVSGFI